MFLFPSNSVMLHKDEDDGEEAPVADAAALHCRRIVNMHTSTTLWIQLPSFEEYGDFLGDAKGSCFSTLCTPKWCTPIHCNSFFYRLESTHILCSAA
jgi:hypothetical protein